MTPASATPTAIASAKPSSTSPSVTQVCRSSRSRLATSSAPMADGGGSSHRSTASSRTPASHAASAPATTSAGSPHRSAAESRPWLEASRGGAPDACAASWSVAAESPLTARPPRAMRRGRRPRTRRPLAGLPAHAP